MRLNLGCSDSIMEGFRNVDIVQPADEIADLSKPWPWKTSSIDYIRAHDIVEHLPSSIHTFNEMWRVLCRGGRAEVVVPTTDGRGAWQDPQHCCYYNRNSFFYFTDGNPHRVRFGDAYGIVARFKIVGEHTEKLRDEVVKLAIILEAVK